MTLRTSARVLVVVGSTFACASSASAQFKVWLDFGGAAGTPQGNVNALNANVFTGKAAAQTAALRDAIVDRVMNDYKKYNIVFSTVNPGGVFTRVVIGNTGTEPDGDTSQVGGGALGIANEIDFRNKRQDNVVSILASEFAGAFDAGTGLFKIANAMAATTSHELGHVLGLVHSDPVSTFSANGAARVQKTEIMRAVVNNNGLFQDPSFGRYSHTKLDIATAGVNVQGEAGNAAFTAPTAADPGFGPDAGDTFAAATPVSFDSKNRVVVKGNLPNGLDTADVYKFSMTAGQLLTAEAFSQVFPPVPDSPNSVGRYTDAFDVVLELIDPMGNVEAAVQFNPGSSFDNVAGGDFGSDALIFEHAVLKTGDYRLKLSGGADAIGDYELFIMAPSPGTGLALAAGLLGWRRRRR